MVVGRADALVMYDLVKEAEELAMVELEMAELETRRLELAIWLGEAEELGWNLALLLLLMMTAVLLAV